VVRGDLLLQRGKINVAGRKRLARSASLPLQPPALNPAQPDLHARAFR
jgi:hypothetical protein